MTFQGPDPYGTPGGFPGPLIVGVVPDVRKADGKTYIAFLVVNATVIERRRSEIDQIIRVIGEGGVSIVAIALTEGTLALGTVIDSAMTELRLASQDFVAQQVSPGIVLVTLERNIAKNTSDSDNTSVSTTLVSTDLLVGSCALVLPGPATSVWDVVAVAWSHYASGGGSIATHLELEHGAGTVVGGGTSLLLSFGPRTDRVQSLGTIVGAQTITVKAYGQQSSAGTLDKRAVKFLVNARRVD